MRLRPLRPEDQGALARMWHQGWGDAHAGVVPEPLARIRTLAEFRSRIAADPASFLVVGAPGAPQAMIRIVGDELDQFYLARELRGTGAARKLMAAAEAEMAARGVREAFLKCSFGNDRARRFYLKAGWTDRGARPATVDTAAGPMVLDVWRFEKTLIADGSAISRSGP